MRKLTVILGIFTLSAFLFGCSTQGPTRFGGATSTSINAGQPNVFTNSITSGAAVATVPADGTDVDWKISTDNNIRCLPQYYGTGTNVPSATVGFLVIGNSVPLMSYPLTDPTFEWDCIAVSTTANVSVLLDKMQ